MILDYYYDIIMVQTAKQCPNPHLVCVQDLCIYQYVQQFQVKLMAVMSVVLRDIYKDISVVVFGHWIRSHKSKKKENNKNNI